MAKIYWAIHGYPPRQNAGAEWMAKEINDTLQSKHQIVIHDPANSLSVELFKEHEADIIFTHLDLSQRATDLAIKAELPCINFIHHTFDIPWLREPYTRNVVLAYNADWVAKRCGYKQSCTIVHPPVNPYRFRGIKYNPGGAITLVNCNRDKGALIFQELARFMPERRFLAVKGQHGRQLNIKARNLMQIEPQPDISEVLKETALLVVPSIYESYGRIALEAMACGIPVVATATPGLKEALNGSDAKFIHNRDIIFAWANSIRSLLYACNSPEEVNNRMDFAQRRYMQATDEVKELSQIIDDMVLKYHH